MTKIADKKKIEQGVSDWGVALIYLAWTIFWFSTVTGAMSLARDYLADQMTMRTVELCVEGKAGLETHTRLAGTTICNINHETK